MPFEPIETQEQLDAIIAKRLKDVKDQAEQVEDLKSQLQSKDEQIAQIEREHFRSDARRAVLDELAASGVVEQGRVERVLRHIDLDEIQPGEGGEPYFGSIRQQLAGVSKDMPELLDYQLGAGSGIGSKKPVLGGEKELTEEDISKMTPEEMAKPGIMERIDRFMAGQRG